MAKKNHAGMGFGTDAPLPDDDSPLPADPRSGCPDAPPAAEAPCAPLPTPHDAASDPPRPRQGNQPICPLHQVPMVAYSSNDTFTYYRCPVEADVPSRIPGGPPVKRRCGSTDKRRRPVGPQKHLYEHGLAPHAPHPTPHE